MHDNNSYCICYCIFKINIPCNYPFLVLFTILIKYNLYICHYRLFSLYNDIIGNVLSLNTHYAISPKLALLLLSLLSLLCTIFVITFAAIIVIVIIIGMISFMMITIIIIIISISLLLLSTSLSLLFCYHSYLHHCSCQFINAVIVLNTSFENIFLSFHR